MRTGRPLANGNIRLYSVHVPSDEDRNIKQPVVSLNIDICPTVLAEHLDRLHTTNKSYLLLGMSNCICPGALVNMYDTQLVQVGTIIVQIDTKKYLGNQWHPIYTILLATIRTSIGDTYQLCTADTLRAR